MRQASCPHLVMKRQLCQSLGHHSGRLLVGRDWELGIGGAGQPRRLAVPREDGWT